MYLIIHTLPVIIFPSDEVSKSDELMSPLYLTPLSDWSERTEVDCSLKEDRYFDFQASTTS